MMRTMMSMLVLVITSKIIKPDETVYEDDADGGNDDT